MRYLLVTLLAAGLSLQGCVSLQAQKTVGSDYEKTGALYQSMIDADSPAVSKLNLFMTNMPKGGDLHHHYSGTVYAESFLDWVEKRSWFVNQCTLRVVRSRTETKDKCPDLSVAEVHKNNQVYRNLLMLWSDKDYSNHYHSQLPPDTKFFNTFGYFGSVAHEYTDLGLQIIKKRAIKENVSYIETMLSTVGVHSSLYFDKTNIARLNNAMRTAKTNDALSIEFDAMVKVLSGDQGFREIVLQFVQSTANVHQGIDDGQFMMRYQTYAVRVLDPVQVFVDLYSGFLAADQSPLVVGVNILAPENNVVALADYTLHMKMYAYLLKQHPNVNRALHAGELTLGMVRPKDLDFHIGQALNIAQAQRIGHGIDLPYEQNSVGLLEDLRKNSVIEINLTSNQHILGVQKEAHPYAIYASYGVPLVISTDDSGVSRNNLSNEYVLLASRYKPGYKTLKSIVYNSILYSFMSDSDKSENLRRLDERFAIFEAKMAGIADRLMH